MLLASDTGSTVTVTSSWNWHSANPTEEELTNSLDFWTAMERDGRILELEALRHGWAQKEDKEVAIPSCFLRDEFAWAAIPLIHHERLIGIVVLTAPEYRRPLDWEDFDLLRTAGRQAAS